MKNTFIVLVIEFPESFHFEKVLDLESTLTYGFQNEKSCKHDAL